jgi:hypothetical protein
MNITAIEPKEDEIAVRIYNASDKYVRLNLTRRCNFPGKQMLQDINQEV